MTGLYTDRVKRIFEIVSDKVNEHQAVTPLHLLLAMCEENTSVCAELHQYFMKQYGFSFLRDYEKRLQPFHPEPVTLDGFSFAMTPMTKEVLELAELRMNRYNQIKVNEGHLMQAILRIDSIIPELFTEKDIRMMEEIVCRARDMMVYLENYVVPKEVQQLSDVRKAAQEDYKAVLELVEKNFGSGWTEAVKNGMEHEDVSVYLAFQEKVIIGFACYEAHGLKRGTFGPMGVTLKSRQKGIGEQLLHHCLYELKKKRYKYAIIEGAGPLEFYEKTVNACLIPVLNERMKMEKEG